MSDTLAIIIGCAGTAFMGWLLYVGFSRGTMQFDYLALHVHGHRKDQPVRFWTATAMISLTMLIFVIGTAVLILY